MRIGKYEVQNELGRGAFGRVYRAYDAGMERLVAIKVLISDGDPNLLQRFRTEAGFVRDRPGNWHGHGKFARFDHAQVGRWPVSIWELLS